MSTVVDQHRAQSPRSVRVAVLTVSDTRTEATDASGDLIAATCEREGHSIIDRQIVADDFERLQSWVKGCRERGDVDAAIITGGTGISPRDQTVEAVDPLFTKTIPGFGELFRMLSHAEIGSACLMSRASAGLVDRLVVFVLPGSRAGVELAMSKIILPEMPHLVQQASKV